VSAQASLWWLAASHRMVDIHSALVEAARTEGLVEGVCIRAEDLAADVVEVSEAEARP
jgi:hypothetical protein